MAGKRRTSRDADQQEDAARGQSFEREQYEATEKEAAREFDGVERPARDEADEFVTDAEMEAREANASPQDDEDL